MDILLIALFGAAGCLLRYGLSGFVYRLSGTFFPYGTLAVNVVGSFFVGAVMQAGSSLTIISSEVRTAIAIGLLGGFTTFSTFSYETLRLFEEGSYGIAGLNVLSNVAVCLLAVYAGMVTIRVLI